MFSDVAVAVAVVVFLNSLIGTFKSEDEDDYEYEFSVLSMHSSKNVGLQTLCACSVRKTCTGTRPRPPIYRSLISTVKTRIIEQHVFWGLRLIWFSYIASFLQNQPENVLKVFLKVFPKLKCCIDYQQMKSMCKHSILINQWISCQHVVSAAKKEFD